MRKQMIEQSAMDVAVQVRAVEDTIEAALMEMAELQGRMLKARSVAGVGVAVGHEALAQVAASLSALVQARGEMAAAHATLVEAKQQVPGLRTVAFGDGQECPETKTAHGGLRVVA